MFSIFIMYSNDRRSQLEMTIDCLKRMPQFEACQKTLIVDGRLTDYVPGFDVVQVPRFNGQFSWSAMWSAGVASARYEKIWYLDSDRLLPENYLEILNERVVDDTFVFTSWHLLVVPGTDFEICRLFLREKEEQNVYSKPEFFARFEFEPRFRTPHHGSGKNVMSGNTAFTKKTFLRLGGVDPWYCGHGAFADTDFHMTAAVGGCKFDDTRCPELHYHHLKIDDQGNAVPKIEIGKMSLHNFVYYCDKWKLPLSLAESMAHKLSIPNRQQYVQDALEQIKGL